MGIESVRLGPCRVFLANTDLGMTSGGVELTVSTQQTQTQIDHFGYRETIDIVTQRLISVKMALAETNLGVLVTSMSTSGATLSQVNGVNTVAISQSIGVDVTKFTQPLFLQSLDPSTRYELDVIIPRAIQYGDLSFAFKVDNLRVFNVAFNGYPDGDNNIVYVVEKNYNPATVGALDSLTSNSENVSANGVQLTF